MTGIIKDLISLLVFIFVTPFRRNKNAVLVYHMIDDIDAVKDPVKMSVPPQLFRKQAEYLSRRKDRYLLTFDDGFESIYTHAFPILKDHGLRASVFITTAYIDGQMDLSDFFYKRYNPMPLSWLQICRMHSTGMEIGSHAVTHRDLASLDAAAARREVSYSKERIESMVGCRVDSFSYPFGSQGTFNRATEEMIGKAGYKKAYVNVMGMDNSKREPFAVKRIRIYGTDNMIRFRMKIRGAYNWVDSVVSMTGSLKSRFSRTGDGNS